MKISRIKAFGVHLLGSMIVALCSTTLVFLIWYPTQFATATGVISIFMILLAVDVIVGPCITLIVFNPTKKELKWDLTIVLMVQIAALLYGLHAVFVARPVYVVFNVDRFDLLYANDFTDEKLAKVNNPQFKSPPMWGPEVIAARRPDDRKERSELMFRALEGGDDLAQLPQYYVPYEDKKGEVLQRLQPMEKLNAFNSQQVEEVESLKQRHAERKGHLGFLPVKGKVRDLVAVVDSESAAVLEFAALNPW